MLLNVDGRILDPVASNQKLPATVTNFVRHCASMPLVAANVSSTEIKALVLVVHMADEPSTIGTAENAPVCVRPLPKGHAIRSDLRHELV
jgi:hypothetical protein